MWYVFIVCISMCVLLVFVVIILLCYILFCVVILRYAVTDNSVSLIVIVSF